MQKAIGYLRNIVGYNGASLINSFLQWISSAVSPNTAVDSTSNALDADYVENNCASVLNGATLTVTGLVGTETITNSGTATPTPSANTITFTAGTVYNLKIDGVLVYPVAEGAGNKAYSIIPETWPDATFSANTWTTQDVIAHNAVNGFSKVLAFNGTSAYATLTTKSLPSDFTYSVCFNADQVTSRRHLLGPPSDAPLGAASSGPYIESGKMNIRSGGAGFVFTNLNVAVGVNYCATFTRTGTSITCSLVDLDVGTTTEQTVSANSEDQSIKFIGKASGFYFSGYIWSVDIGTSSYLTKDAYNNGTDIILPDSTGTNDATGTNVAEKYIPALADGTDDVEGLGLTNPAGLVHNNSESKIKQKWLYISTPSTGGDTPTQAGLNQVLKWFDSGEVADGEPILYDENEVYALWYISAEDFHVITEISDIPIFDYDDYYEGTSDVVGTFEGTGGDWTGILTISKIDLLNNQFWSADGENYDAKSWADFIAHHNFDNNVVLRWDANCWLSDAVTWSSTYSWTPSAYTKVSGWVGTPCYASSLEPLVDDSDDYILDDDGKIIFTD